MKKTLLYVYVMVWSGEMDVHLEAPLHISDTNRLYIRKHEAGDVAEG